MGDSIKVPEISDKYLLENVFDMNSQRPSKLKLGDLVEDVDSNRFKTSYEERVKQEKGKLS